MSVRRPHPKSKLGCANCKQRRVKCDEGRPGCWNCYKRKLTCSFHTFDPALRSSPTTLATTSSRISSHVHTFALQQNHIPTSLPDQTLLDLLTQNGSVHQAPDHAQAHSLKLLRHFATETVKTTTYGTKAQLAWCGAIPQLASQHNFVLHGVLSLAALHLSRLAVTVEEREHYQNQAAIKLNTGMSQYKIEISNVTTKNAEALFAFSTVITGYFLLNAKTECENHLRSMHDTERYPGHKRRIVYDMSQVIVRVLRCLRGVLVILVPGWNQIHDGPLQPIVQRENWPPSTPETDQEKADDQRLRKLEQMWSRPGRGYDYHVDTLRQVLKNLRESSLLVSRVSKEVPIESTAADITTFDWTSVFQWPVQCPLDFLGLLDQRQTDSWVLTAHYAMLLARVKGLWWLDGLAANFAVTAALVIGRENWDWIAWPLEFIGIDMDALRNLAAIHENSQPAQTGGAYQLSAI